VATYWFSLLPDSYSFGPNKPQLTLSDWIFYPIKSYRQYRGKDKPVQDTLICGGPWREFYSKSANLGESIVELYASLGKTWSDEMMFMFEQSRFYEHSRHLGFQYWTCMVTRVQVNENGKITVLPWEDEREASK
jgi:hypothetical protein